MRIAFISDIHGNGIALRQALSSIEHKQIDKVVCLGDVSYGGPEPIECLRLVRKYTDYCVIGNTDEALIKYHSSGSNIAPVYDENVKWVGELLNTEDMEYLMSLPLSIEVPNNNITIRAFHGTMSSNKNEFTNNDMVALAEQDMQRILYAFGHTHKSYIFHHGKACF